jgi:hypothetical protein
VAEDHAARWLGGGLLKKDQIALEISTMGKDTGSQRRINMKFVVNLLVLWGIAVSLISGVACGRKEPPSKGAKKDLNEQEKKTAGSKTDKATEPRYNVFYVFKFGNTTNYNAVYSKLSSKIHGGESTSTVLTRTFSQKSPQVEVKFEFRFVKQQDDKDLWEVTRIVKAKDKEPFKKIAEVSFVGVDTVVFDDDYGTLSLHKESQKK